jgi:hypothetical protein
MTLRTLSIIILTLTFWVDTGCNANNVNSKIAKNDTTEVLRILIDSAFYHERLPDFGFLTRNNPFGDTIIFKFDSILVGHLPTNLKYKLLTQDEICSLARLHCYDANHFCTFLKLNSLKKNDNKYEVYLQNQCVMPLFDKNGKQLFDSAFIQRHNYSKCTFGGLCGGGMSMTFIKQADTIKAKIDGFWSD